MQEIIIGVLLFTGIVMILSILIIIVRSFLFPVGFVTIQVNERSTIEVPVGGQLLTSLAANDIFIPSACGGRGSCGQCRVNILQGGGDILPLESSHITKREAQQGVRLACQVTIEQNMRIQVPDTMFNIKRRQCTVQSNKHVSTFIRELVLKLPEGECLDFRAGEFVIIECPPYKLHFSEFDTPGLYHDDWQRLGLYELESKNEAVEERAYSMANYPEENDVIMLNVRIATPPPRHPRGTPPGIVSSFLFGLKPSDTVTLMGPFGDFFVKETNAEMVFVGGGAGMAPMRAHILDQLKSIKSKRTISFWYGARSLREAFYIETFEQLALEHKNFNFHLVLSEPLPEDNWTGYNGFIHEVLFENYLKTHPSPEDCEFYLCGPPMMIAALGYILDELGVEKDNILFDDFGG
jgi:Na+-transporting NADH:ubiquinone oxidoreductase subunit F